jgi:hypothetical protein
MMNDDLGHLLLNTESKIAFGDQDLDVLLDTDTVEIFTLERFKDLVVSHFRNGLDFIIAEIATRGHTGGSIFHSFYSASEINRILFCVDEANRLLYRVRTRNPINNLDAVGEVKYYRLTRELVQKDIIRKLEAAGKELPVEGPSGPEKGCCTLEHSMQMPFVIQRYCEVPDVLRRLFKSLVLHAELFATDEDVLFRPEIKEYIERNSLYGEIGYIHLYSKQGGAIVLYSDSLETEGEEKTSLRLMLYANIGTVLAMLGMCLFLSHSESLIGAIVPLALAFFFSSFLLLLYIIIFETPERILGILCFDKDG